MKVTTKPKTKRVKLEHLVTAADLAAAPDLVKQGVQAGEIVQIAEDDGVPTFTLRADSPMGLRTMIALCQDAYAPLISPRVSMTLDERTAIVTAMREFEAWANANPA
jgi:hypothetical protein